jgi:Tfp pilus assembly protein PilF
MHLLGVVALRTYKFDDAVGSLRRAIGARPSFPDAFSNLAVALEARGQLVKAGRNQTGGEIKREIKRDIHVL